MNNFEKIQTVILANKAWKITISEISRITGIERNSVKKCLQKYDTDKTLHEFIVDGRKTKFNSEAVNPLTDSNVLKRRGCFELMKWEDPSSGIGPVSRATLSNLLDESRTETAKKCSSNKFEVTRPSDFKTIYYSNLNKCRKVQKYVFDSSLLELDCSQFLSILEKLFDKGIVPKFCIYANDIVELDTNKEEFVLARELLKFFALDLDGKFHFLINEEKTNEEQLAELCKKNDYTLISGKAKNIAWCKLYQVDVVIPDLFLEKFPNPCCGTGIVGVDSCMMAIKPVEMDNVLRDYEKILISDIQLNEINGGYLLNLIAYYGEIRFSNKTTKDQDYNICLFYQENTVRDVYTFDYGCYLFGKLCQINIILYKYTNASKSSILKAIADMVSQNQDELKIGDEIILDQMTQESVSLNLNEFPDISVFSKNGVKRKDQNKKAYSQDFLVIRQNKYIVIAKITKLKCAIVYYCGTESNVPEEYKVFLA